MKFFRHFFFGGLVATILCVAASPAKAQIFAYDDAGNGVVWTNNPVGVAAQTWTNGMNTGFGWATPWVLLQTVRDNTHQNYAGFYNGNGSAIATANSSSWGMFANGNYDGVKPLYNGTNKAMAVRGFASLTTNQVFKLQWLTKGIASGGTTNNRGGFALRNGVATNSFLDYDTGSRLDFYYAASGGSFLIRDGTGITATGLPFTSAGYNCEFTPQAGNLYRLVIRNVADNSVAYIADGRPLAGTGTIDSVACYDLQCQDGDQNFNRMQIVSTSLIPPIIANIQPTNGSYFVSPASKVSFEVDSQASTVSGGGITLLLNGVAQTLAFNMNGGTRQLLVTNTASLATNVTYNATIIATDANGNAVTNLFGFNTLQTNSLWLDVKSYGAAGDGVTSDTAAIQSAINACPAGGFVWLHNATFFSGTISLKNNMTLFIDPTATLLGSGSAGDYPTQSPPLSNSQLLNCQRALVYAQTCTNLTITGGGTINGNGRANFTSGVEATRPIAIWLAACNQVNLQNINIVDASMWTVVPMQTDFLTVSNITINDDGLGGNRDGIDPVDCWHLTIANCAIDSGDDSICLKSGNSRGVNDVLVKNCTVTRSQSNGLKFGTASSGPFTNITFQDCTLQNVSHSVMAVESVDGGAISGVTFQRIIFSGCQNAIFIVLGSRSGATVGSVNGITYRDITGSGMTDTRGSPIMGQFTNGVTSYVKNLRFDNVNIYYKGGLNFIPTDPPVEYTGQYPENTIWTNLPAYGYYLRHATNVVFTNCFTGATPGDARPWMANADVLGLKVYGPVLSQVTGPTGQVLLWKYNFVLQSAAAVNGTYADVAGAPDPYTNGIAGGQRFFRLRQ
ncbi:MAG TPA: glycosyl hydrolase family 28 protein [Verrucomicrobiae bacterium]|nr:glycosyl hydrolase family 28 protein [Verrucomicrobiae bacterium]